LRPTGGFTAGRPLPEPNSSADTSRVEDKEYERLKEMTRDQMSNAEYEYFVMKQTPRRSRDRGRFYKLMITGDRSEDVVLLNGDQIVIPQKPIRLWSPAGGKSRRHSLQTGADLKYYVARAGGYTWTPTPGASR
jgi:protein involved in polysaccharide export with SLBB domain